MQSANANLQKCVIRTAAVLFWPAGPLLAVLVLCCNVCQLPLVTQAHAEEPTGTAASQTASLPEAVQAEVAQLVTQLDAAEFEDRAAAADRLAELVARTELAAALAVELDKALQRSPASYEVRTQLAALLGQLPSIRLTPPPELSAAEIMRLVGQLGDDKFAERESAAAQLGRIVAGGRQTFEIMPLFKERLSDPQISGVERAQIRKFWEQAREAWLQSDPATWKLPDAGDEQIASWVEVLGSKADGSLSAKIRRRSASRELNDLLARQEYVPRVKAALTKRLVELRLAETNDTAAIARLNKKLDLLKPAMVAEIWMDRQNVTIQHLLVDVPQIPDGAPRATHFDRIDDKQAHCVSGNSLLPGNYPVGIAIAHPRAQDKMYHLINLPTPHARLLYDYRAKHSDAERLQAITQRTVDRYLEDKRHLTENEIMMLLQLDPEVCSRFVGPFFKVVADQPIERGELRRTGQPTHHGAICFMLAHMGTHAAIDALETAVRDKQVTEPALESPYHIVWIAALAIAQRDPWQGVDEWLAGKIANAEPLVVNVEPAPELGATAAAMLLKRHEMDVSPFGLQPDADSFIQRFGFVAYRFSVPAKRDEVLRWWKKRKADEAARRAS